MHEGIGIGRGRPPVGEATRAIRRDLGARLETLAARLHGGRRGSKEAFQRRFSLSAKSWYYWRQGTGTLPPEVLLRVIVETGVRPEWLLRGTGPLFGEGRPLPCPATGTDDPGGRPA